MNLPKLNKVMTSLPFSKKEKITQEQVELKKRISQETIDLKKIVYSSWYNFKTPFKKVNVFTFFESTLSKTNNQLQHLKSSFDHDVAALRETSFKFLNFVLPSDKTKHLEVIEERTLQSEIAKSKLQSVDNHHAIVEGTKAETDINNAMIESLASKTELKKAQHSATAVDNAGLDIELNANYKSEILNKAKDESIALVNDSDLVKPSAELPTYPTQKIVEQKSFTPFQSNYSKPQVEVVQGHIQKTVFKDKTKNPSSQNAVSTTSFGDDYYLSKKQFSENQHRYGMDWADANFPDVATEDSVSLSSNTTKELDYSNVQETFLGTISRFKVNMTFAIVFLAMIPEYLIYSKILSSIFEYEGVKALLTGTGVLLLSKGGAMIIYGSVLEFFKKQSLVFRFRSIKSNRFFMFLFIVSLLYCFCIGLLYKDYKDEQKATKEYVMLQQTTVQIQDDASLEQNPNQEDLKDKLDKAQQDADKAKDKLFKNNGKTDYLKIFTIGFSGAIILLFSSCVFAMALIFSTALHLRLKKEKLSKQIATTESRFKAQKDMMFVFRQKAFRIFCLIGELEFLRRLEHDFEFDPTPQLNNEVTTIQSDPLPLNETTPEQTENV